MHVYHCNVYSLYILMMIMKIMITRALTLQSADLRQATSVSLCKSNQLFPARMLTNPENFVPCMNADLS